MGILGFFVMIIVFCIAVGHNGYDRGLTYYRRDEAREKGQVFYVDGHGQTRSTKTHERVLINGNAGCSLVYTEKGRKIIEDNNAKKLVGRNKNLAERGMKIRYGLVYFNTYMMKGKQPFKPENCGNVWIGIENETNRPVIFECPKLWGGSDSRWYKYYFINDQVGVTSGSSKGRGVRYYYFPCNIDRESKTLVTDEEFALYDIYSNYRAMPLVHLRGLDKAFQDELDCVYFIKS